MPPPLPPNGRCWRRFPRGYRLASARLYPAIPAAVAGFAPEGLLLIVARTAGLGSTTNSPARLPSICTRVSPTAAVRLNPRPRVGILNERARITVCGVVPPLRAAAVLEMRFIQFQKLAGGQLVGKAKWPPSPQLARAGKRASPCRYVATAGSKHRVHPVPAPADKLLPESRNRA